MLLPWVECKGGRRRRRSKLPPPFRQLNKFDTAKATRDTDYNYNSYNCNGKRGRCARGVQERRDGEELLQVLVAFISKTPALIPFKRFLNFTELHGRAYAKCRPSERGRERERGICTPPYRDGFGDGDAQGGADSSLCPRIIEPPHKTKTELKLKLETVDDT